MSVSLLIVAFLILVAYKIYSSRRSLYVVAVKMWCPHSVSLIDLISTINTKDVILIVDLLSVFAKSQLAKFNIDQSKIQFVPFVFKKSLCGTYVPILRKLFISQLKKNCRKY